MPTARSRNTSAGCKLTANLSGTSSLMYVEHSQAGLATSSSCETYSSPRPSPPSEWRRGEEKSGLGAGFDAGGAGEFAVDFGDALDLTLGGKAFVKSFVAEVADLFEPRRQAL